MTYMNGWQAFRTGAVRVLKYPWVCLTAFAANLGGALGLALLSSTGLALLLAYRPALHSAIDGIPAWLGIETLLSPLIDTHLELEGTVFSAATRQLIAGSLIALLLSPLATWVPSSFLAGGALLTYTEAPQRFRWRRFLWGSWHWFGSFLVLGAAQGLSGLIILGVAGAVLSIAFSLGWNWSVWMLLPLVGVFALYWLAFFEFARGRAVVQRTRHPLRMIGEGLRIIALRPLSTLALYSITLLLLLAVHVIYKRGIITWAPPGWWLLRFLLQQAFVVSRLGVGLTRLAGAAAFCMETRADSTEGQAQRNTGNGRNHIPVYT